MQEIISQKAFEFKEKVPFDPYASKFVHLNHRKLDEKSTEKQSELVQSLLSTFAEVINLWLNRLQVGKSLEAMITVLINWFEGLTPVGDNLNQATQKFTNYLQRVTYA